MSEIKGYKQLSETQILMINHLKDLGSNLENIIQILNSFPNTDKRWVAIGRTDLETGIMALVRAVANPD
jgi:DNA-binding transcriptional MerR regulator